ncbi:MAG: hypothetical protein R6V03_02005 [Kiritimatiellia bacterium]
MKKSITIMLIAASVLCFGISAVLHDSLLDMRGKYELDSVEPLENAPPLMAFTTVLLGGFRGLIADVLWLRISYLQDEDRYLEIAQLADWITKLEPRFTDVWSFHAWNMAYNVSVMLSDPQSRWLWVKNGIELLRDEGMRYNPGDPKLYFELGWMFQHKIAGLADSANPYYKRKWAGEMEELLGGGHPDYGALGGRPETLRRMREEYKLLPELMREIDRLYGPLDWRVPETHALYWAWRGRKHAGEDGSLWCERMILQSLAAIFMHGNLTYKPQDNLFLAEPNLEILPKALEAYRKALDRYDSEGLANSYLSFVRNAVIMLYTFNREEEARRLFRSASAGTDAAGMGSDFEAYIARSMEGPLSKMPKDKVVAIAEGYMYRSFIRLAAGDRDRAAGLEKLAKLKWNEYLADKSPETVVRLGLPAFAEIRRRALDRARSELPETLRRQLNAEFDK